MTPSLELVKTPAENAAAAAGDAAGTAKEHKLWGGRFAGGPAAALEKLNRSLDVDFRLWPFDIELSKAWAVGLWTAGVLTREESARLERGLDAVARRLGEGTVTPLPSDEDVHTLIDRLLHEEVGDLAARLHTGRSRNDQVATATRLWAQDACLKLDVAARELQGALLTQAESLGSALMPAYTHLQRAQPVLAAHWMLAHFWPLERDRARLAAAGRAAQASLPLGAGAIAGSAYPVSRVLLKESLGFTAPSPNSIDAVSDRDFVAELLFAVALLGTHLSRLAEDLILFGSSEFGFVKFGDGFSTGSSMMPQKRNPDALELARATGGRVLGDLTALLATMKGLPSGYNKDMQEDKRSLFDAVDAALLVLPATAGAVAELTFDTGRMRAALTAGMMATDLADYLVRKGATFREAHGAVGALVRQAEQQGVELGALPSEAFTAAHALFGPDARGMLSPDASVALREIEGGTGPSAVRAQLVQAQLALKGPRVTPGNGVSAVAG
ncbi:MAG TPA: argininosuccinate lyase [Gemmatimonadaceae bacterium]|nr:argininosuccinate lyase [Gemmatimonadaceae bacterium]